MATIYERSFQIWPILVLPARNRQVLNYEHVSDATGMFTGGLGNCLEPIQSYCMIKGFPPLTMLVVKKGSGLPGMGFSAINIQTPEDFAETLQAIFDFNWAGNAPSIEELTSAALSLPSNAGRDQ